MRSIIIILLGVVLAGCATTAKDLRQEDPETWVAQEPIEQVFREYKEYIDNEIAWSGLLGQNVGQESHFYGDSAEVAIKMTGNPMGRNTYLYFDLRAQDGATKITAWPYNGAWRRKIADFRALSD